MKKNIILLSLIIFSLGCGSRPAQDSKTLSVLKAQETLGFEKALEKRKFSFPEDHGPHSKFKTEWWYVTGNLKSSDGREFGYQWTIFRNALTPEQASSLSAWSTNQTYMGHLGLSDISKKRFYSFEKFSRGALGLAEAVTKPFHVHLDNWSMSGWGPSLIKAKADNIELELTLEPGKGPILQGDEGLSQKSTEKGNASYYYSFPRMSTKGRVIINGEVMEVSGQSWFDREWSTSSLSKDQRGWDWFALQLQDGREIMLYQLREKDGGFSPVSEATVIDAKGQTKRFNQARGEFVLTVNESWKSLQTGVTYPSSWQLQIPSEKISLNIQPKMKAQEHRFQFRYWEGAVSVQGGEAGQALEGEGYVELTGY